MLTVIIVEQKGQEQRYSPSPRVVKIIHWLLQHAERITDFEAINITIRCKHSSVRVVVEEFHEAK